MAAASGEKDGFPLGSQLFCRFAGGRIPAARGCRSYLYMCTNNLFYFVYMAYFFIAFHKFLSII